MHTSVLVNILLSLWIFFCPCEYSFFYPLCYFIRYPYFCLSFQLWSNCRKSSVVNGEHELFSSCSVLCELMLGMSLSLISFFLLVYFSMCQMPWFLSLPFYIMSCTLCIKLQRTRIVFILMLHVLHKHDLWVKNVCFLFGRNIKLG